MAQGIYSDGKRHRDIEILLKKYPTDVVTMLSAYFYHGLTDNVPDKIHLAVERDGTKIRDANVVEYFVPRGTGGIGAVNAGFYGLDIRIFDGNGCSSKPCGCVRKCRQFLVDKLAKYREKERVKPERGICVHGRGHIARSYIYANTFCNILKEHGVKVDENAVILGIVGHDLGRQGLGADRWEKQSADKTVQDVSAHYGPDAMGPAYSQELADSIEKVKVGGPDGNPVDVTKSNTLEAQLLNAADCLDIGRTAEFDPAYFDFLRDKNGHVSPEATKIRDQLIAEADLLQRLTNPICATKQVTNHLTQLQLDSPDHEFVMQLQQQKDDLDAENTKNLIYETEHVDDGPYFDKIEDAIRSHPDLFPLFTKYYLDAA